MNALTERDIVLKLDRDPRPVAIEYLSGSSITVSDQLPESAISPTWLGRVKTRLKGLKSLPPDWDSYGAAPIDPGVVDLAEKLVEWFAVDGMPSPDVFATAEGGVQIEWHIRRANIEIAISPDEKTPIYFHDLNTGEEWTKPGSSIALQIVRRRLLTNV